MQYTYEELCPLNMTHSGELYLVRQKESGLLAVKKTASANLYYLYEKLLRIRHPNLMQIIEVEQQEEKCIIIEEYICGETLACKLKKGVRYTEKEVKRYLQMLCDALQTLHENQIIHRDITPNNIMLTTDDALKLCDFDISRIYDRSKTTDTQLLGTHGYAAPEQYGYGQIDAQSDIYGAGKIAAIMLSGNASGGYRKFNRFGRIINKATAIDKKDRYKSINQMKEALLRPDIDTRFKKLSFLRSVFGFRSFTPWKMLIAIIAYPLLIAFSWDFTSKAFTNAVNILVFFVIPWLLYTDMFHLSKTLLKMNSEQKWFRIVIGLSIRLICFYLYL